MVEEEFKRKENHHRVRIQTPEDHAAAEVKQAIEADLGLTPSK